MHQSGGLCCDTRSLNERSRWWAAVCDRQQVRCDGFVSSQAHAPLFRQRLSGTRWYLSVVHGGSSANLLNFIAVLVLSEPVQTQNSDLRELIRGLEEKLNLQSRLENRDLTSAFHHTFMLGGFNYGLTHIVEPSVWVRPLGSPRSGSDVWLSYPLQKADSPAQGSHKSHSDKMSLMLARRTSVKEGGVYVAVPAC